jgi:hypothetical protein
VPDTRNSAESLLGEVERQLDVVDAGLLASDPAGLPGSSTDLRDVAVAFSRVLEAALSAEAFDPAFRRRVEAVAQRLATQRQSIARRNVVVERALASIFRPQAEATYAKVGERPAFAGH